MRIPGTNVGFPLIHLDVLCPPDTQVVVVVCSCPYDLFKSINTVSSRLSADLFTSKHIYHHQL